VENIILDADQADVQFCGWRMFENIDRETENSLQMIPLPRILSMGIESDKGKKGKINIWRRREQQ
jgi:hypothetical protein